jgi:hypothetical protein
MTTTPLALGAGRTADDAAGRTADDGAGRTADDGAGRYAPDALLTLVEIAELLGRDLKTIKTWNAKGQGRWPNAVQDAAGRRAWRVPVSDLVTAGDLPASQVRHIQNELTARREARETQTLREQIARLEERLAAANALAQERAGTIALLTSLLPTGGAA